MIRYAQIIADITTTSIPQVQATGLTATINVPTGGRRVKITFFSRSVSNNTTGSYAQIGIWVGAVVSGTRIGGSSNRAGIGAQDIPGTCVAYHNASAGSVTYNIGYNAAISGTANLSALATEPAFICVEWA